MDGVVLLLQRRPFGTGEFPEGVMERFRWEIRVQPRQGIPQPLPEDYLLVVLPFGEKPVRGDFRAVLHLPAQLREPGQPGGFDIRFSKGANVNLFPSGGLCLLDAEVHRARS